MKFKCLKVWYTFSRTRFLTWMHVHVAVEWKSTKPVIISIYAVLRTSCSCFGTWFHGLHNCDYLKCRGTWDQLREPHSSTSGWTRIYLFTEKLCHYSTEVIQSQLQAGGRVSVTWHSINLLININIIIHSLIRSFIHSFIHSHFHSFIHLFIHSHVHSFIHSFTHSFIHTVIYSFIHLFINSFIHSCIHSFTRSFIHTVIHSLINSFTRSFIHSFI